MPGSTAPFEGAHRHLEGVAGIDHQRVGRCDQRVPVRRLDIGADLPRRIDRGIPERDDFLLQPDLQPLERHLGSARKLEFEIVEPATEEGAVLQLPDERVDTLIAARNGAVDAFMRQQHTALDPKAGRKRAQRLAQLPEVRQRGELVEGGDLERHGDRLSGRPGRGNPVKPCVFRVLPPPVLGMPAIALPGKNMPRTVCKPARCSPRDAQKTLKRKHSR